MCPPTHTYTAKLYSTDSFQEAIYHHPTPKNPAWQQKSTENTCASCGIWKASILSVKYEVSCLSRSFKLSCRTCNMCSVSRIVWSCCSKQICLLTAWILKQKSKLHSMITFEFAHRKIWIWNKMRTAISFLADKGCNLSTEFFKIMNHSQQKST